jgi:sterol desaturase/sphingolipid hydroxylase (fatty acid hydroxylase superfamily)
MDDLLQRLNDLTPVIAVVGLALFMTVERSLPYFEYGIERPRQRWHNLGLVLAVFIVVGALASVLVVPVVWADAHRFGLMYRLGVPWPLAMMIGVFLIDLWNYAQHVTMHSVPALWRIHRVHHADTALDASSGIRAHPIEIALLTFVLGCGMALLGVPMASLIIYNAISLPWFLLNHSNIRFPVWFERWGSLVMSTPDFHRVHHSSHQSETDSHYGCVFSIWDRLFGTAGSADVPRLQFGLDRFRGRDEQTVWRLLKMPFEKL